MINKSPKQTKNGLVTPLNSSFFLFDDMFYSSPYSAFFTSGLLSVNEYPSSNDSLRRGSLPVTVNSCHSVNVNDDGSVFYFSMQPKRNLKESRSFLSLDLAESYSVRSASLKRKAQPYVSVNPFRLGLIFDRISTVESAFGFMPAAKPVPSTALPAIPKNRVLNSYTGMSISKYAPIRRRGTYNTSSTVSTGYRRVKRNDALARLEGRTRPPTPNFMHLDDEDDEGDDWDIVQHASPVDIASPQDHHHTTATSLTTLMSVMMEDENIILPSSPAEKSRASSTQSYHSAITNNTRSSSSGKKRARASSWLPLRSFIDLEDAPGSAPWRSFIEISALS